MLCIPWKLLPIFSRRERVVLHASCAGLICGAICFLAITVAFVAQYVVDRSHWFWEPLKLVTGWSGIGMLLAVAVVWIFSRRD